VRDIKEFIGVLIRVTGGGETTERFTQKVRQ